MLLSVLTIITLPSLTESLSEHRILDWKSYSHPDCLLAATVTVENFDANQIPYSFSASFRVIFLSLVFQISFHCAWVWASHHLPSLILLGETFPS